MFFYRLIHFAILTFWVEGTLSEQIAHSTVDLHLKEISEFLHGSMMNKDFTLPFSLNCVSTVESAELTPDWADLTQCKFLLHWAVHMRYKSYTRVSCSTYTHKIQPLRLRPIGPIASESVQHSQSCECYKLVKITNFEKSVYWLLLVIKVFLCQTSCPLRTVHS